MWVCVCICVFNIGTRAVGATELKFGMELGSLKTGSWGPYSSKGAFLGHPFKTILSNCILGCIWDKKLVGSETFKHYSSKSSLVGIKKILSMIFIEPTIGVDKHSHGTIWSISAVQISLSVGCTKNSGNFIFCIHCKNSFVRCICWHSFALHVKDITCAQ